MESTEVEQEDAHAHNATFSRQPLPQVINHRQTVRNARWAGKKKNVYLPYETLRKHRDALLEAELKYRKAIRELEVEREEIVISYENTYQENRKLREILSHGPDAQKMKKLTKDKWEQKGLIEKLEEENKMLGDKVKNLERQMAHPREVLERKWHKTLEKVKKKRAEEDSIPRNGPFDAKHVSKNKRMTIDDMHDEALDAYDVQLDVILKETQVLLNKVQQLKREKENIDFTKVLGHGPSSKNATVAKAASEQLNRDLNKFAIRLEKLKIKHAGAKRYIGDVRQIVHNKQEKKQEQQDSDAETKVEEEEKAQSPPVVTKKNNKKEKKWRTYKRTGKSETDLLELEKGEISEIPGPDVPATNPTSSTIGVKPPKPKLKIPMNTNFIRPKHFEKPDSYSKIFQNKSQASINVGTKTGTPVVSYDKDMLATGITLNNNFRDDMRIQKAKHRIQSSSQGNNTERQGQPSQDRLDQRHPDYNFESNTVNYFSKQPQQFLRSPPNRRDSKHPTEENATYDEVLNYLGRQTGGSETRVRFNQGYRENRERPYSLSPVPIRFTNDGRLVNARESLYLMGNSGIRRQNIYQYI